MKEYETVARVRAEADTFAMPDNVDSERFAALPDVIDLNKTLFNVIIKPGFDEKRAALAARPAEDPAYIL